MLLIEAKNILTKRALIFELHIPNDFIFLYSNLTAHIIKCTSNTFFCTCQNSSCFEPTLVGREVYDQLDQQGVWFYQFFHNISIAQR